MQRGRLDFRMSRARICSSLVQQHISVLHHDSEELEDGCEVINAVDNVCWFSGLSLGCITGCGPLTFALYLPDGSARWLESR